MPEVFGMGVLEVEKEKIAKALKDKIGLREVEVRRTLSKDALIINAVSLILDSWILSEICRILDKLGYEVNHWLVMGYKDGLIAMEVWVKKVVE